MAAKRIEIRNTCGWSGISQGLDVEDIRSPATHVELLRKRVSFGLVGGRGVDVLSEVSSKGFIREMKIPESQIQRIVQLIRYYLSWLGPHLWSPAYQDESGGRQPIAGI